MSKALHKELMQNNFNRMTLHLLKQGVRSLHRVGVGTACAYRGAYGRRCAVGFLIADEHYAPCLEGRRATQDVVWNALCKSGAAVPPKQGEQAHTHKGVEGALLEAVQRVHDNFPPDLWASELQSVARGFDLTYPHALANEMLARDPWAEATPCPGNAPMDHPVKKPAKPAKKPRKLEHA